MGIYKIKKSDYKTIKVDGKDRTAVTKIKWNSFNSSILGLGDISQESIIVSAIAAVFDLEGFTNFCKQIDPQLSTPTYLNQFLNWFFEKIKEETMNSEQTEGVALWHNLPILIKFLGDGILIIWNTEGMSKNIQGNIIVSCQTICNNYVKEFLPKIQKKVSEVPLKLRCGLAKGNIFSVGNGNDFVGPCINFASRLQKLPGVQFVFANRGFNVEEYWEPAALNFWEIKHVKVRGIGDSELIYIPKTDFDKMSPDDKKGYTSF